MGGAATGFRCGLGMGWTYKKCALPVPRPELTQPDLFANPGKKRGCGDREGIERGQNKLTWMSQNQLERIRADFKLKPVCFI